MTDRKSRLRLSKLEKLASTALKEREERENKAVKELPLHAQRHATAVAAIVLSGQPKIDEPLIMAWARALQHYGINVNVPGGMDDQVRAAQRLLPIIIGGEDSSARFTEIFSTAPVWLLQCTGISMDARLLKFHVPDISQRLRWGSAGYEDARRWPLLPSGVMTAGDPIPTYDPRQLWLILFCIMTVGDPIQGFETRLSLEREANRSHRAIDPLVDDFFFALNLDGKPEEEWCGYEKRRMRKLAEPISQLRGRAGAPNIFTHEIKHALLKAGENFGNRLTTIHNAKLPKSPNKSFTRELLELSRLAPKGIVSYFEWLAEHYPNIYAALLGRALSHILRHESGDGAIEVVNRSAEELEMAFRENNLPPLQEIFQLPRRIDLNNPETIDVTPEKSCT